MNILLVLLICLIAFVPIFLEIKKNQFDVFNIKNAFIIYYVIQLAFSGLISLYANLPSELSINPILDIEYYTLSFIASFLGIFFFQIGYYFSSDITLKIPNFFQFRLKKINVYFILFFYSIFGIISFFLLIKNYGSINEFIINRESFRTNDMTGNGVFVFPATHLFNLGVFIFILYRLKSNVTRKNILFLLFLLFVSIIPSIILGFRAFMILPILEFVLIFNYCYKKVNLKKIIPISIIFMSVFVVLGIYREIPVGIDVSPSAAIEVVKENPQLAYSFLSRSKGNEIVASVLKKTDQTNEHEYGLSALIEMFTIFIPSSIWSNKPTPNSVKFTTYFFADDLSFSRGVSKDSWGGVSPTIIGEAFWHFGWLGIIVFMTFLGFIHKKIYFTFLKNKNNVFVVLIYAEIFPSMIMMAETFQGYVNGIVINMIVLMISLFFLKIKII